MISPKLKRQLGYSMISTLTFIGVASLVTLGISSQLSNISKARSGGDDALRGRARNDAAIQIVSQLVNSGSIYFNVPTKRVLPGSKAASDRWTWIAASGANKNRDQVQVTICENKPQKRTAKATGYLENQGVCSAGEVDVPVTVTFLTFTTKGAEWHGEAEISSQNGPTPHLTKADVNFGSYDANRLNSYVAKTDMCFFMKQKNYGNSQVAGYEQSGKVSQNWWTLEPKADGAGPNEFRASFDLGQVPTNDPGTYEILPDFRPRLLQIYQAGFRDANLIIKDISPSSKQFIGVTPQIPNGPQFQYFLARGQPEGGTHYPYWNPAYQPYYKNGCAGTTGDGSADFCTRIDVPLKEYKAAYFSSCTPVKKTLRRGERLSVNKEVQVKCNSNWPNIVNSYVAKVESESRRNGNPIEFTAKNYLALIDLNSDGPYADSVRRMTTQLTKTGAIDLLALQSANKNLAEIEDLQDQEELLLKAKAELLADAKIPAKGAKDDINAAAKGDPDDDVDPKLQAKIATIEKQIAELDAEMQLLQRQPPPDVNQDIHHGDIVYVGSKKLREVNYWELENTKNPKYRLDDGYNSRRCVYFKYYDIAKPQSCRVEVLTKDNNGWWVCRTNDGCFEESTPIKMGNGEMKIASELKKGDLVFNPKTGKPSAIDYLTVGPEQEPMYRVGFNDDVSIQVTQTHPFFTKTRGWQMAKNLMVNDEISTENGQWAKLNIVKQVDSKTVPKVVNFALVGDPKNLDEHFVLANGIVTGDLVVQKLLESDNDLLIP